MLAAALLFSAGLREAGAAPVRALVEVFLNGQAMGPTILLRDGEAWYAAEEDFQAWRLRTDQTRSIESAGRGWRLLNDLPEARLQFDDGEQRLEVALAPAAFEGSRLDRLAGLRGEAPTLSQARGGFLNYALFATRAPGTASVNGLFEVVAFGPGHAFTTTVAGLNLFGAQDGRRDHFVRLDSQWRRDDPENTRSLLIGDSFSGAGLVGRSTRFAGVQWRSDFSLRPGFVKFERPSLAGQAATPSVVELYVDGQLRGRTEVAPGPFEIPPIPFVSGRGEATVVVRDIFGRQQVITQPFNATSSLLRQGVEEFSYEAGAVRRDFGLRSWRYGTLFASGLWRRGWTPSLTTEARVEASRKQAMAGGAVTMQLPLSVLATAGGAASAGERGNGALSVIAFDAGMPKRFNLNLGQQRTHRDFRQPALEGEGGFARRQANATLSVPLERFGRMALSRVAVDNGTQPVRVLSLSYSVSLAGSSALAISVSRTTASDITHGVFAVLSIPFGERGSANVSQSRSGASTSFIAGLQQPPPLDGGWGYRLAANRINAADRLDAGASGRFGALEASLDISRNAAATQVRADLRGALVRADGSWHASRQVLDGFALVRAPGLAGAPVHVNNVPIGRTDRDGDFVVTPVFAYGGARISVGTDDLPIELSVEPGELRVAAGHRGGSIAKFRVVRDDGILLQVRMPDGTALRQGATLRAAGQEEEALVGYGGKAFFPGLRLPARLVAEMPQVRDPKAQPARCGFDLADLPADRRALAATRGIEVTCAPLQ